VKLITQDEAAKRLGVSSSTVKRLRIDGKLTYIPGRPVLIDEADLEKYIAAKAEADAKKADALIETPAQRARRVWIVRRAHLLTKAKFRDKP
jgi:excisionase family DNA binding protein